MNEPGPVKLDVLAPAPERVDRCVSAVLAGAFPVPTLAGEIWALGRGALAAGAVLAAVAWGVALWPGRRPPPAPPQIPAYAPIPVDLLISSRGEADAP